MIEALNELKSRMQKAADGLVKELAAIRTGRATPVLLDNIVVDYHGTLVPLQQIATISVPEANLIIIQPWDRAAIQGIQKAILTSGIGLNPSNDGNVVRVTIPPLSEERRIELAKLVAKKVEERRVALRNIRREGVAKLREMERDKEISRDDLEINAKQIDKLTDIFMEQVNGIGRDKEREIKEV